MKLNAIKTLLAAALSLALAFICEIIAPEIDGRNWISLGICFVTAFALLLPAMGISYENSRKGVSLKVFAWIAAVTLLVTNVVFSSTMYRIDVYIGVSLLLSVMAWVILYGIFSAK